MESWRSVRGIDWLCVPPPGEPTAADASSAEPQPRFAALGFVFAHGYAHETAADLGIGAAALYALGGEAGRPRETGAGVVDVGVSWFVNLEAAGLSVRGTPEAVAAAARAVEALLADPHPLAGAGRERSRSFAWSGWQHELTAWFGYGPAVHAAEDEEPWDGPDEALLSFIASLDPARGRRAVVWTSDESLVGSVLSAPVGRPHGSGSLRWREPSPTSQATAVRSRYLNHLLSIRSSPQLVDQFAVWFLARRLDHALVGLSRLVPSLGMSVETVGDSVLVGIVARTSPGPTDWLRVRRVVVETLAAYAECTDELLFEELTAAARHGMTTTNVAEYAELALLTGHRTDPERVARELDLITLTEIREALSRTRAQTLLSVFEGELESGELPGQQPYDPPRLPPVAPPALEIKARGKLRGEHGPVRQLVRASPRQLESITVPTRIDNPMVDRPRTDSLDLTRVALRLDRGERTSLVDAENRRVHLLWSALRRPEELRQLLDAATPEAVRIRLAEEPPVPAQPIPKPPKQPEPLRAKIAWYVCLAVMAAGLVLIVLRILA